MHQEKEKEIQLIENIVQINENRMFTTSLVIAEAFEKEHKNVLRDIENLECSEEFNRLNFEPVEYKDAKGEMRPAYRITRDGFAFLAMGFTGKKAAAWKEKFLAAFNAMEQQLLQPEYSRLLAAREQLPRVPDPRENVALHKCRFLNALAAYWAFVDQLSLKQARNILCAVLGLGSFEEAAENFSEAFDFLIKVSHTPGTNDNPASPELIEIAQALLDACSAFKYTASSDFDLTLQSFCGVDRAGLAHLTENGARKVIMAAWGFLNHAWRYTTDMGELEKLGLLLTPEEQDEQEKKVN